MQCCNVVNNVLYNNGRVIKMNYFLLSIFSQLCTIMPRMYIFTLKSNNRLQQIDIVEGVKFDSSVSNLFKKEVPLPFKSTDK